MVKSLKKDNSSEDHSNNILSQLSKLLNYIKWLFTKSEDDFFLL